MRGQNATLVNGFSCLGQPWVLMPSYHPHLPQQASQECFLQGGSCTHCHSSRSLGEAAAGGDMSTARMASGPAPEAWATLLPLAPRLHLTLLVPLLTQGEQDSSDAHEARTDHPAQLQAFPV